MAPGCHIIRRSLCVNTLANFAGELDELAGQGSIRGSNAGSDKTSVEALTLSEAFTLPLVPPYSENLFIKFMKVFMKITKARDQLEPRECPLTTRTPKTYSGKSHMDCYHFCQQCKDYFKISGATRINCIPFATTFFRGAISLWWAQHKRRHKCATLIIWSKFKDFLRKDLGSSQAFIDSIWSKFRRDS